MIRSEVLASLFNGWILYEVIRNRGPGQLSPKYGIMDIEEQGTDSDWRAMKAQGKANSLVCFVMFCLIVFDTYLGSAPCG
jgi:hypothetical protein